jgi:hypothetical protein
MTPGNSGSVCLALGCSWCRRLGVEARFGVGGSVFVRCPDRVCLAFSRGDDGCFREAAIIEIDGCCRICRRRSCGRWSGERLVVVRWGREAWRRVRVARMGVSEAGWMVRMVTLRRRGEANGMWMQNGDGSWCREGRRQRRKRARWRRRQVSDRVKGHGGQVFRDGEGGTEERLAESAEETDVGPR